MSWKQDFKIKRQCHKDKETEGTVYFDGRHKEESLLGHYI